MSVQPLTPRQAGVLAFIKASIAATGIAPTLDEIRSDCGVASLATVHKHVTALERKGHLTRASGKRMRSIVVLGACPYCGADRPTEVSS